MSSTIDFVDLTGDDSDDSENTAAGTSTTKNGVSAGIPKQEEPPAAAAEHQLGADGKWNPQKTNKDLEKESDESKTTATTSTMTIAATTTNTSESSSSGLKNTASPMSNTHAGASGTTSIQVNGESNQKAAVPTRTLPLSKGGPERNSPQGEQGTTASHVSSVEGKSTYDAGVPGTASVQANEDSNQKATASARTFSLSEGRPERNSPQREQGATASHVSSVECKPADNACLPGIASVQANGDSNQKAIVSTRTFSLSEGEPERNSPQGEQGATTSHVSSVEGKPTNNAGVPGTASVQANGDSNQKANAAIRTFSLSEGGPERNSPQGEQGATTSHVSPIEGKSTPNTGAPGTESIQLTLNQKAAAYEHEPDRKSPQGEQGATASHVSSVEGNQAVPGKRQRKRTERYQPPDNQEPQPKRQKSLDTRKQPSITHALLLNGESTPGHSLQPTNEKESTSDALQDPLFRSDRYLSPVEMELLWLGEESMFALGKKTFDFKFIFQHATAALRVELLRLDSVASEKEKIKLILRPNDSLVTYRFEQLRESLRCAFDRGYRRPSMRKTIAEARVERQEQTSHTMAEPLHTFKPLSPSNHPIRLRRSVLEQIRKDQGRISGVLINGHKRKSKSSVKRPALNKGASNNKRVPSKGAPNNLPSKGALNNAALNNGTIVQANPSAKAKYRNGTRFLKEFEGYGTFEGEVVGFNGYFYSIYYREDGDQEDMTEATLESFLNQRQTTDRSKWKNPPGGS